MVDGPSMIRNENGLLAGYVYVDMAGRDIGGYVDRREGSGGGERVAARRATRSSGAASTRTCSGSASG